MMASTPTSPTPSHLSPSTTFPRAAIELTPRSKVKQLLASLDDSDDDALATRTEAPAELINKPIPPTHSPKVNTIPAKGQISDSDDSSDVPQARQGTKAARMRTDTSQQDDRSDDSSAGAAYRRVRRRLLAKPPVEAQQEEARATITTTRKADGTTMEQSLPASPKSTTNLRPGSASPDLFVSPEKGHDASRLTQSSELEHTTIRPTNIADRLQALADRRKQEERAKKATISSDEESDPTPAKHNIAKSRKRPRVRAESETDNDVEATKALTQQARPTRKASKKAIEEMHRETQRMSRNMQLTHEARTKTKFSTADLFAKFNFRQGKTALPQTKAQEQNASSSTNQSSDAEGLMGHETPPSSPPSLANEHIFKTLEEDSRTNQVQTEQVNDSRPTLEVDMDDLPDLQTLLAQKAQKTHAPSNDVASHVTIDDDAAVSAVSKRASARRFAKSAAKPRTPDGSDDDLEIVRPRKASRLPIFDMIPASKAKESHSLHALRALAHLNESEKTRRKGKKSLTPLELQTMLHKRARVQALQERDEKIQRLREKGVIIQTADEKEKEQLQLESMLERARKEADDLAKKERKAAKQEGKEDGSAILDDDDDEDYEASDEEEVAQLSGSEDDGENEEEEVADGSDYGKDEAGEPRGNDLVNGEASDDGEEDPSDDDREGDSDQTEGEVDTMLPPRPRPSRRKVVDSDDEDEDSQPKARDEIDATPDIPVTPATISVPKTPKTSTSDAFGFSNRKPTAPLGLSQVFAGTMAEDQTQGFGVHDTTTNLDQDSMDFLRSLPAPDLPGYDDSPVADSPRTVIEDSQVKETPTRRTGSQLINLVNFDTQTQRLGGQTQISELLEPTQDDGFQVKDSQPLPNATYSTADTIPVERVSISPEKQPSKKRIGKLVRRSANATMIESQDEDQGNNAESDDEPTLLDAFEHMRQKRAEVPKVQEAFDKKQSKAKTMVEEQAEESEDEYAGLGGASDDEEQEEADEETKKMIDDNGNELTDERDIAAYYA